jgi:hypothetical protein
MKDRKMKWKEEEMLEREDKRRYWNIKGNTA